MIRLFRVFFPKSVVALMVSEVLLTFGIFILITYLLQPDEAEIFLWYDNGIYQIAIVVLSVLLGLYFHDLYTNLRIRSMLLLAQQLTMTVGIVFLLQALLAYLNPVLMMSRPLLLAGSALLLILLPLWRILYTRIIYKGLGIDNLIFVGFNPTVEEIARCVNQNSELGIRILGALDDKQEAGTEVNGVPILGPIADLRTIARTLQPHRIVVSLSERRAVLPVYELLDLRFSGIPIEEATNTYETVFGRVAIRTLRPSQLIFSSELAPRGWRLRMQTLFSLAVGLVGVLIAAPIMTLVALAVRVTSTGPALYRQTRVGLNGKPFMVYKFRSMVVDAEKKSGAVWASKNDPRVTTVGRIIRKTRLDELPQLFNVLKGEMAIVGPRPERPEFVATLSEQIPFYPQRHFVKPGLTGWAQINYKYGDTIEDTITKLEYDLYYIKNMSLSLDLYIMFNTAKTMLLTRGAH